MIIADIQFPENYKKSKYKQNVYLENLKNQALYFLRLHYLANNKNIQDSRNRIVILEDYINKNYEINCSIYDIVRFMIKNLKYDVDRKFIILDNEIKLKGVKVLTLIKIIKFGALEVKGSDIIDVSLKAAFNSIYVNNFLVNFRF